MFRLTINTEYMTKKETNDRLSDFQRKISNILNNLVEEADELDLQLIMSYGLADEDQEGSMVTELQHSFVGQNTEFFESYLEDVIDNLYDSVDDSDSEESDEFEDFEN